MATYQLTINEDFTSTVVFGSYAPEEFFPEGSAEEGTDLEMGEDVSITDAVLEDTAPSTAPEAFVASLHIKLPNYDYTHPFVVRRFTSNQLVEEFVESQKVMLKNLAKSVWSIPTEGDEEPVATDPEYPEVISIKADIVRNQRNVLLMESDWTQAADSPLSDDDKAAWATYRTSLRNLSDHANWPELLPEDWPTKP